MNLPKDLRFLIIDDMLAMREILKYHLKELGFTHPPVVAVSAEEAYEHLEKLAPTENCIQFILADWHLPGMSGYDLLLKVRGKKSSYQEVPYLMISSESELNSMINAVSAGCTDYLIKPWTLESLKAKLENCWQLAGENVPRPAKVAKLAATGDGSSLRKSTGTAGKAPVVPAGKPTARPKDQASAGGEEKEKKAIWDKITSIFQKK